jgi:hypothetical protein
MNFGCQNATSEKENNKRKNDYQKSVEKVITSNLYETVSAKNNTTLLPQNNPSDPWSNHYLWESFVNTKSYALFSAKINDKLPPFNFKIVGQLKKDDRINPADVYFLPSYVEIYDASKSKVIQKLNAKDKFDNDGSGWKSVGCDNVQMVDINFDGYLDLRLFYNAGATGNVWYATYIYKPDLRKFVFSKRLFKLSDVSIDPKKKQLSSTYHGGVGASGTEYFKFVDNKLVSIKYERK